MERDNELANFLQNPSQSSDLSYVVDGGNKTEEKNTVKKSKKRKRRGKKKTEDSSSERIEMLESMPEKFEGGDGNYDELLLEKKAVREQ